MQGPAFTEAAAHLLCLPVQEQSLRGCARCRPWTIRIWISPWTCSHAGGILLRLSDMILVMKSSKRSMLTSTQQSSVDEHLCHVITEAR
mmetsp:Transcript_131935/g.186200  ORF Transcript_131935/g.186200 Transcript_131935/m.186200 type:complete len:89 (-) Transcript_131935:436-702(-)